MKWNCSSHRAVVGRMANMHFGRCPGCGEYGLLAPHMRLPATIVEPWAVTIPTVDYFGPWPGREHVDRLEHDA